MKAILKYKENNELKQVEFTYDGTYEDYLEQIDLIIKERNIKKIDIISVN